LLDLLVPAAPGRLDAFPVSGAVGNVRNNGPELIEPLPLDAGNNVALMPVVQSGGNRCWHVLNT
jgi:hypothetical protein